jgi:RNA polymerase sigma factor (sigma-70 family)
MRNAHERELHAAEVFLREHPEFRQPEDRFDTGETAEKEESQPIRFGGQRVLTGYDNLPHDLVSVWPTNESRTAEERELSVRLERILDRMRPEQADLLRRVYWEREPQESIAKELGVSQQAVSQRITTAENALKRCIAEHGMDVEVLKVAEEEL